MTPDELEIIRLLAQCFIKFNELPIYHKSDAPEFVNAIHQCQNIVMSRMATRALPEVFPTKDK